MLALGAVPVDDVRGEGFYAECKPVSDIWVPEALAICEEGGLNREVLTVTGEEPESVMRRFAIWVADTAGSRYPVFTAWPAGFDWSFVHCYFVRYLGSDPFGFAGYRDIREYAAGAFAGTGQDVSKSALKRRFGITESEFPHTHNPLDDAREQAELFNRIRAYTEANPRP